jgi:xanthine dehydrogenase YagS FAD-binding subunit
MNSFGYAKPGTIDDAVSLLSSEWGKTEVLAGGTDLLSSIKNGISTPDLLVSLKDVEGLNKISKKGSTLHIGATASLADLQNDKTAAKNFPAITTAIKNIGSTQIINMGTVGGDLLQRPRCWFYRNGLGLFGNDLVADGDNRYHAIFGNSGKAKFVHASSLAPALIALGATVHVQGSNGKKDIAAAKFFATPKSENDRESVLKPNEILTGVSVPLSGMKNGTYEIRPRVGLDWPMVAASVAIKGNDATVVLGHVAPTPWIVESADNPTKGATPLSRNGYKVQQVKVAVKRAIQAAKDA